MSRDKRKVRIGNSLNERNRRKRGGTSYRKRREKATAGGDLGLLCGITVARRMIVNTC